MTLNWHRHDHIVGTICATGLRGTYTITESKLYWWLTVTGHDGLPILQLPHAGHPYARLPAAQAHAEHIDNTPAEAWTSGT